MPSILSTALHCRCPACGKGRLYAGLLAVRDQCELCHLSFKQHEKGDGAAFFGIIIVGFVVTTLAGIVEYQYEPPYWVHAALWLPLIVVLSLLCLRVFKAGIIAWQYRLTGLR